MKALYYDAFAGVSGDMILGALIDLGADFKFICSELSKLGLDHEFSIEAVKESKNGILGTKVVVHDLNSHEHTHEEHSNESSHAHTHVESRNFGQIKQIILLSQLEESVKALAVHVFEILAVAEGKVHGKSIDEVHFHEVGAIDSIVDIVGCAIAFKSLGIEAVLSGPVELGSGFVKCAHGYMPVPAPATVEILKGVPVMSRVHGFEMTTPTGAAFLKGTVQVYEENKNFTIEKVAYGLGQRTLEVPNVLRVMVVVLPHKKKNEQWLIETNIDDMTPEQMVFAEEVLLGSGALDVFRTPIVMKKGRSAFQLSVLCKAQDLEKIQQIIVTQTSSIGMRMFSVEKFALERQFEEVETPLGCVVLKRAYYNGKLVNQKPEYEDCKRIALDKNIPIKEVYETLSGWLWRER